MSTPTDLKARYGAPSPVLRQVGRGAVLVLGVVFVGWVLWAAAFHATPPVKSELFSFDVNDEHSVTVVLDVTLADGVDDADCLVRAQSEDKSVVGEISFTPIQGRQEIEMRTDRRATAVEVLGCRTPDEPRRR
ncbi:DUF4307 domain-containing protein [Nocardioides yefusunii]|uniref:DUF4307 domain-containing protein n=1 Tax=Nocardioides yefusunii TaxID=2500546 RepID=A0ABW1QVN5_9ACTN|nr:DUF4307 domain-containing protein [Nocardioides yefusunii]